MKLVHGSLLALLCLSLTSCIFSSKKPTDAEADSTLGVVAEEQTGDAQQTLEELREERLKEQKRALERQITDLDVARQNQSTNPN